MWSGLQFDVTQRWGQTQGSIIVSQQQLLELGLEAVDDRLRSRRTALRR